MLFDNFLPCKSGFELKTAQSVYYKYSVIIWFEITLMILSKLTKKFVQFQGYRGLQAYASRQSLGSVLSGDSRGCYR